MGLMRGWSRVGKCPGATGPYNEHCQKWVKIDEQRIIQCVEWRLIIGAASIKLYRLCTFSLHCLTEHVELIRQVVFISHPAYRNSIDHPYCPFVLCGAVTDRCNIITLLTYLQQSSNHHRSLVESLLRGWTVCSMGWSLEVCDWWVSTENQFRSSMSSDIR